MMLLAASPAFAIQKADFLVIGEVRHLLIYNQYQQRLSSDEKAAVPAFSPFKILDSETFLGDGFTPCLKVEMNGRMFFLEKDSTGRIAGALSASIITYKNGAAVGDTIEIVRERSVIFTDPLRNSKMPLARGTRLVRLFRHQGMTYVRMSGTAGEFGWIRLDNSGDWKRVKDSGVSLIDRLEKAVPLVALKVNEANGKLARLYEHFNSTSSRKLEAPAWNVHATAESVVCALESGVPPAAFAASSTALAKSIEGTLLGSGLRVTGSPGRVVISGGRR